MDRHAEGPLDALWSAVAAGAGPAALTTPISAGEIYPCTPPCTLWLLHVCWRVIRQASSQDALPQETEAFLYASAYIFGLHYAKNSLTASAYLETR